MTGLLSASGIPSDGILWTDAKDALTKPIYALYTNGSLSYGKIEILQEYEKYV